MARGFGDLSENSEYDEAKNEQGKLYSRIAELEEILQHVVIVDESAARVQRHHHRLHGHGAGPQDRQARAVLQDRRLSGVRSHARRHLARNPPSARRSSAPRRDREVMVEAPFGIIHYTRCERSSAEERRQWLNKKNSQAAAGAEPV